MKQRHLHEANRRSWNTGHQRPQQPQKGPGCFSPGRREHSFPEEKELLGPISGLRLAHLQCNAGQDSLSLAALGARVTGVDISDEAINFADQLATESGIAAEFVRADVYDWLAQFEGEPFDVVFCSYGALCWLSDLEEWARGVASILRPGGRFVCVEFHPFSMVFDEHFNVAYPYFADGKPLTWDDGVGDYVGMAQTALAPSGFVEGEKGYENPHPVHEFQWAIAEVLQALIDAGLAIETMREFPYSNGAKLFDDLVEIEGRRFVRPEGKPNLPLMWAAVATNSG